MPPTLNDITAALQDYLEAILRLEEQDDAARVSDIASRVGVGKPAVTSAMKTLAARGLVNYEAYHCVTLTEKGRRLADEIQHRHVVLRQFLTQILALDAQVADVNACRMEHAVDEDVLDRLAQLTRRIQSDRQGTAAFIQAFHRALSHEDAELKGDA
jgi:DtxR family Mn-dependent transcriptional regulator